MLLNGSSKILNPSMAKPEKMLATCETSSETHGLRLHGERMAFGFDSASAGDDDQEKR